MTPLFHSIISRKINVNEGSVLLIKVFKLLSIYVRILPYVIVIVSFWSYYKFCTSFILHYRYTNI